MLISLWNISATFNVKYAFLDDTSVSSKEVMRTCSLKIVYWKIWHNGVSAFCML